MQKPDKAETHLIRGRSYDALPPTNDAMKPPTPASTAEGKDCDSRLSLDIAHIQSPSVSINLSSAKFTLPTFDEKEKRDRQIAEDTRDRREHQEHEKKDEDDDKGDRKDFNIPEASRTAHGKSQKLSLSALQDQPCHRRSYSGAETEDGEIWKCQHGDSHLGAQSSAPEGSSSRKVTDDRKIQELIPSETPDRPREYNLLPRMSPVSRLDLPENFLEELPHLGNGRCYQRQNVPSEYVPPGLNDVISSSESSNSGEEILANNSEAEEELNEEESDGEVLQMIREVHQSLNPSARISNTSSQRKRFLLPTVTPFSPRRNPQVLHLRGKDVPPRIKKEGEESPDIEAWTESPKLPPLRNCGNQEIIRAKNRLIYLVTSSTVMPRISSHTRRIAELFGRRSDLELLRSAGATRIVHSTRANPQSTRMTNPGTLSSSIGTLSSEWSPVEMESFIPTRNGVSAQHSNTSHETVYMGHVVFAGTETQNLISGTRNTQS